MTSFGKTNIQDKFPHNRQRSHRLGYLPIHPATHPDTSLQLHLDRCPPLRLESYVNIRDKHTIPLAILQAYEGVGIRYSLASDSYRDLAGRTGFQLPTSSILSVGAGSNATTVNGITASNTALSTTGRPVPKASKSRPRQSAPSATVLVSSRTPVPGKTPISATTQPVSSNRSLPATKGSSHHPSTHPRQPPTHVTVLVASQAPVLPSAPVPARTQLPPANRPLLTTHGSTATQPGLPVAYGTFPAASAVPIAPSASVTIARLQPGVENRPLLASQGQSHSSIQATPRITTSGQPDTLPLYYSNHLDNDGGDDSQNGRPPAVVVLIVLGFIIYKVWSAWAQQGDIGANLLWGAI